MVYLDDKILVEVDLQDSVRLIGLIRETARAQGAERVVAQVLGYNGHLDQRFSVDVMWEFLSNSGHPVATAEIRYFCRLDGDIIGVEMMEYIQAPFPGLTAEAPMSRLQH